MARGVAPTLHIERDLWAAGHEIVVGMDEVGKGAWAGPLTVGAAVLPTGQRVNGVRDSKVLTERTREELYERIAPWCVAWSVGHASNQECDELGMSAAQRLAARRALEALGCVPDQVLMDGRWDFVGGSNTQTIIKGDQTCLSIAAASVLAKVTRDRMMREHASAFPAFAFDRNKGYPSPVHRQALSEHGPTSLHRCSWSFMDDLRGWERKLRGTTLFD